jgi:hypothetical protein
MVRRAGRTEAPLLLLLVHLLLLERGDPAPQALVHCGRVDGRGLAALLRLRAVCRAHRRRHSGRRPARGRVCGASRRRSGRRGSGGRRRPGGRWLHGRGRGRGGLVRVGWGSAVHGAPTRAGGKGEAAEGEQRAARVQRARGDLAETGRTCGDRGLTFFLSTDVCQLPVSDRRVLWCSLPDRAVVDDWEEMPCARLTRGCTRTSSRAPTLTSGVPSTFRLDAALRFVLRGARDSHGSWS